MSFPSRLARSILQQPSKLGSPVSSLKLRPTALVRSQHASRPGRSFGTGGRTTSSKDKESRTAVWAVVRYLRVPRRPSHQAHLHAFSTALRPDARCDLSDDLPHPARLSSRSATRKDVSGRERCRSQKTQLARELLGRGRSSGGGRLQGLGRDTLVGLSPWCVLLFLTYFEDRD